jgi:hypothetical protein
VQRRQAAKQARAEELDAELLAGLADRRLEE